MKTIVGDYLIVKGFTNRNRLVKFTEQRESEYLGVVVGGSDSDVSVTFTAKDIVANLGKSPQAGTVYGIKVEPLLRTIKDKRYGEIRLYRRLNDQQLDRLMVELDTFWSTIKSNNHHKVPYDLEVRNPQGKYAGYYKYFPREDRDILAIKPDGNLEGCQYLLAHEHGHGIYNRWCQLRTQNAWVRLYHKYVAVSEATIEDLQQILEEIHVSGSLHSYLKEVDDETKAVVKACLSYVQQVHRVNKHHLELALSVHEKLDAYWPITSLDFSERQLVITDYSRKSPEEFFAEAYAFFLTKKQLPKDVDKLLVSTLSKLVR